MPVLITCGRCGAHIERRPCPHCTPEKNRQLHQKRKASGYWSSHWKNLRARVLERDGYTCQYPGCGARHDLTVHLRSELRGNHRAATEADCITVCRSHHGTVDAPRATRR